jgi:hypothetical protein
LWLVRVRLVRVRFVGTAESGSEQAWIGQREVDVRPANGTQPLQGFLGRI